MTRNDRSFARDGDASAVEVSEILFDVIPRNVDSGFGVSDAGLGFNVVLASGRLKNFRVALKTNSVKLLKTFLTNETKTKTF